jgi:hypothetical protein
MRRWSHQGANRAKLDRRTEPDRFCDVRFGTSDDRKQGVSDTTPHAPCAAQFGHDECVVGSGVTGTQRDVSLRTRRNDSFEVGRRLCLFDHVDSIIDRQIEEAPMLPRVDRR